MTPLILTVAPNGAYKQASDHPAVSLTAGIQHCQISSNCITDILLARGNRLLLQSGFQDSLSVAESSELLLSPHLPLRYDLDTANQLGLVHGFVFLAGGLGSGRDGWCALPFAAVARYSAPGIRPGGRLPFVSRKER